MSVMLSWRSAGMPITNGRLPAAERMDADLARKLDAEADVLERQLIILDYCFTRYAGLPPDNLVRYEDVIRTRGKALVKINPYAEGLDEPLESRNRLWIGRDQATAQIAERLLRLDSACWQYYEKSEVEALLA
jgi:hypothetical protein